ncbi:L-threonylcarbamoyladenylate synthase [Limnochorda pilosa]|uniref:Threonylcarbamoyl-AMP synthase n=1 Tax=Limnochorda pilosa TaxID=1555112 RepID=A0A0K2SP66_LIMPI|nr:L-threonylcarbamoyladenylate synthase [Limnochorda pilosa]BAS28928.1 tRNA threonylcarbamoyladenosine biosynthesis protein [Limnochorda pilosa]
MDRIATVLRRVDPTRPDGPTIQEAAAILRRGGLVAFPTETVYGLGAVVTNRGALRRIFEAKGRPGDNPLILHVAQAEEAARWVRQVPPAGRVLMERFWPGPLTLVLARAPAVPDEATGGLDTVAVRLPAHAVARALIRAAGAAVAAPSANTSGRPSPTTAQAVWEDLNGRVELILDGGPAGLGVESTVLDLTHPVPVVLRPGGVSVEQLETLLGRVEVDPAVEDGVLEGPARSPGLRYRHYAPQAPALLLEGPAGAVARRAAELAEAAHRRGRRVGLLVMAEEAAALAPNLPPGSVLRVLGARDAPEEAARRLYPALREMDRLGLDEVILAAPARRGLGLAVLDRMRRAAGYRVERL